MKFDFRHLLLTCSFAFSAVTAHAAILTNGGFETGDLTGWTTTSSTDFINVFNPAVDGAFTHSGDYAASLTSGGDPVSLSQTVATRLNGIYTIDFFLANFGGGTPNALDLYWAGSDVLSFVDSTDFVLEQFRQFSVDVTATDLSSALSFALVNVNDYWILDDVSVTDTGRTFVPVVPVESAPHDVSEPDTVALFGLALMGLLTCRRKRAA